MIRESLAVARVTAAARRDAAAGVYAPEEVVIADQGAPEEPFDPIGNREHRRLQEARANTALLDDLRDDETAERRAMPLRSIIWRIPFVIVCAGADAISAAAICRSYGFAEGPSLILGTILSFGIIWLASLIRGTRGQLIARLGLITLVAAVVVLRLQATSAEGGTASGEGAMAIFFGALTLLPALFGEAQLREIRTRLTANVLLRDTAKRRKAAEKGVNTADKRIRAIQTKAVDDARFRQRLDAVYRREWRLARVEHTTPPEAAGPAIRLDQSPYIAPHHTEDH